MPPDAQGVGAKGEVPMGGVGGFASGLWFVRRRGLVGGLGSQLSVFLQFGVQWGDCFCRNLLGRILQVVR